MRRLACVACGFAASVFAFVYLVQVRSGLLFTAGCICFFVAFWLLRRDWARKIALLLAGAAVGFSWCAAYWQVYRAPLETLDGATMIVTVTAQNYSRQTDYGKTVPVSLCHEGRDYKAVLYYDTEVDLSPGDTATVKAAVRLTGSVPGDDNLYLGSKGKSLVLSARAPLTVLPGERLPLRYWPTAFADHLRRAVDECLDADTAPFANALVTGDRANFTFTMKNQLSVAGLYHAVAISGMHISILLGILLTILGSGRRKAAFIGLPVIWFYTLAVGGGPPVVRAAVMQSFLLLAPLAGRENDTPTALLTALALILIPNPLAAADVSLQLSFASFTGILLFSGRCYHFFWDSRPVKVLRKRSKALGGLSKFILAALASSLAVMPTTLPLSAIYFGMFSLIAPVSSILLLPVISLCFSWGLLTGLTWMLLPELGRLLAWPLNWMVRYCTGAADWLSEIPFASVYTGTAYMAAFLVFFYGVTLFLALGKRRCKPLLVICCVILVLCLCLLLGSLELDGAFLSVTMLDVGQGQSVYLESAGVGALYDCGGSGEKTGEIVARHLQSLGRAKLDFLIVSHYDRDHTEGIAFLLSRLPVGTLLLPDIEPADETRELLEQCGRENGVPVRFMGQNEVLHFGAGAIRLFAPQPGARSNDGSMAALCSVSDFDVLLTGDLSTAGEQKLLRENELPDIELLAAGHHGAATSTSAALLRVLRPEIVLISVGEGNSYGHPAAETLARLEQTGTKIYRTDQCGHITIRR